VLERQGKEGRQRGEEAPAGGQHDDAEAEERVLDPEEALVWRCEFCGQANNFVLDESEIPKAECLDYLVEPAALQDHDGASSSPSVVFVVDISGSMCVTKEVPGQVNLRGAQKKKPAAWDQFMPGQRRDTTFISRLECVQAAVCKQLQDLKSKSPNTRAGVICFNREVTVLGDGSDTPITFAGDLLSSYDDLSREASQKLALRKPVRETSDMLVQKVWALEETGSTALGPAVLCALSLVGANGSIILCTDGLANVGLGNMEGAQEQETAESFYRRVAEEARSKGIVINTVSIEGEDCRLENLGILADLTSGRVDIVDPLELEKNFGSILEKPIIAKNVKLHFLLSSHMYVRSVHDDGSDMVDVQEEKGREAKTKTNRVEKEIGNVNAASDISFEYGVKPEADLTNSGIEFLPFQVQIHYTRLDGSKCVRVVTKRQKTTAQMEEALREVDYSVITHNAQQQAGIMAQRGDYEGAMMWQRNNLSFLSSRPPQDDRQRSAVNSYMTHASELDGQLDSLLRLESASSASSPSTSDPHSRARERQRQRSDQAARVIYQAKSGSRSDWQ